MKKLFISADMEGCGAVSSENALLPGRWEWTAARAWMTNEVVAAAKAAFASDYDEVIVADGHGNAQNIDPDALPDNVRLIRSWPRPLLQMQGVEDPDVRACAFIGYHAGSDAAGSILAHNYSGALRRIFVNGVQCSEGYLNAALAGEFNVPVVFVTGDQHVCADAQRYAPGGRHLQTKRSIGKRAQESLAPGQICRLIESELIAALQAPLPPPMKIEGPYSFEIELGTHLAAEMLSYLPEVERASSFSVQTSFSDLKQAMQFLTFAMFYSSSGTMPY